MHYNQTSSRFKSFVESVTVEQIEQYSDDVRRGKIVCTLPACSRCNTPSAWFKRHEARRRHFKVVVDQLVQAVFCLLIRWKCPACNKKFTHYPNFAVPYKHYTLPTIMAFSRRYIEQAPVTYRSLIRDAHLGYAPPCDGAIDERQMVHSTIHRWISTLGSFTQTTRHALNLVLQADPSSSIARDLARISVHPKKYRSTFRKQLLVRCRQLLHLDDFYQLAFQSSIFPNLATLRRFI